jgi:hypothetical protein
VRRATGDGLVDWYLIIDSKQPALGRYILRAKKAKRCSQTGTRTRVCWVRASHPNHLDYLGSPQSNLHTQTHTQHHNTHNITTQHNTTQHTHTPYTYTNTNTNTIHDLSHTHYLLLTTYHLHQTSTSTAHPHPRTIDCLRLHQKHDARYANTDN